MDSGTWVKQLLEERFLKASEVERISRSLADAKGNSDYYVSHATLADVVAGSVPSIYKIFSLAVCLKVPYEQLLFVFGVEPREVMNFGTAKDGSGTELQSAQPMDLRPQGFRFQLHFDRHIDPNETTLLHQDLAQSGLLSGPQHQGLNPQRFRYALIGLQDDSMGDVIPPGSLIEIDKEQSTIVVFAWKTLRERPIYFVWHQEGYSCCWCQQEGNELILVPHPASRRLVRRLRTPRDASVIGTVVNAWSTFQRVRSAG